jgi:hypothetical protein
LIGSSKGAVTGKTCHWWESPAQAFMTSTLAAI